MRDIIENIIVVVFLANLAWITRRDWYARIVTWLPLWLARKVMWTPNAVSMVMRKIPYASDKSVYGDEEHWATPEEFWKHKCGDCEDYALFAMGVMRDYGYQSYMYTYPIDDKVGHALGVITKDMEHYFVFDLWNVYEVKAKTFQAAGDWVRYNIVRLV